MIGCHTEKNQSLVLCRLQASHHDRHRKTMVELYQQMGI